MDLTQRIGAEYDLDDGFIGRLRSGTFDPEGAGRLLALLAKLPDDMQTFDRGLVSLLWYLPLVIDWNTERVPAADQARVKALRDEVINRLEVILGAP